MKSKYAGTVMGLLSAFVLGIIVAVGVIKPPTAAAQGKGSKIVGFSSFNGYPIVLYQTADGSLLSCQYGATGRIEGCMKLTVPQL